MTKVSFDTDYDAYLFECIGHTEFGQPGQDILCSAVSILCYTLREFLQDAAERGAVYRYRENFSPGYVRMEFETEENTAGTIDCILAILQGFRILEEAFPDYMEVAV